MNQKQLKCIRRELKQSDADLVSQETGGASHSSKPQGTMQVAQGCDKRTIKIAKKLHAKIKANLASQPNISLNMRDTILGNAAKRIHDTAVAANDRHHHHNTKKSPDMVANSMVSNKPDPRKVSIKIA